MSLETAPGSISHRPSLPAPPVQTVSPGSFFLPFFPARYKILHPQLSLSFQERRTATADVEPAIAFCARRKKREISFRAQFRYAARTV